MDKNTLIGLLLIAAVLFGWSYMNQPDPEQMNAAQIAPPQKEQAEKTNQDSANSLQAIDSTALFAGQKLIADSTMTGEKNGFVTLKNENVTVEISKRGGVVSKVTLNNYKSYQDFKDEKNNPLQLYTTDNGLGEMNFSFKSANGTINTKDYLFTPIASTDSTVTMKLIAADSSALAFTYKLLPGDNYVMSMDVKAENLDKHIAADNKMLSIDWHQKLRSHEKGYTFENQYTNITYKLSADGTEKLSEMSNEQETAEGPTDWVAFKGQYFSTVFIAPTSEFQNLKVESNMPQSESDRSFLKDCHAAMEIPFDRTGEKATQFQFYFGPNKFSLLQSMDEKLAGEKALDLEELVYLGWPLIKWINRFFTIYVFDFFTSFGLPMGIVLLLITILLRFIVYAPTRKSFLSSAKMRVLRPKIDEISKKYPNQADAMKKQQETMALYSQYGVSPMGGCLPILIQMPIWIAMFNFVPNAIELRQQSFLWAEDLSAYDSPIEFGTHIWGIGDHLSLFCLLFCATNILYSWMSMRQQRESMPAEQLQQMKVMQWMMYLMPVMFFFMFNDYSSGLNYYYFISLLASALTMWYLRKTTDDAKLLEQLEANYKANKNNPNKKPKGLAARLEALQKQAAEMDAQRGKTRK